MKLLLKVLTSLTESNINKNAILYELVKTVAFKIYYDKVYIEEFKELRANNILSAKIDEVLDDLKKDGFIHNIDKDGIPIWNSMRNTYMYKYMKSNELLIRDFVNIWGNRQRYNDGILSNTLDVMRLSIALDEFSKVNNYSDAQILTALKDYLNSFKLTNGGYCGLSNADNFVKNYLLSYILKGSTNKSNTKNPSFYKDL